MIHRPTLALALLGLALPCAAALAGEQPATANRPGYFEVRLPDDARLEVDDTATKSTGPVRVFESPELPAGKVYTYRLKATWKGKTAARKVEVRSGQLSQVVFGAEDFAAEAPKAVGGKGPPARDGFVTLESEGYWWVFRDGSKELAAFRKEGAPEKHVTRINVPPLKRTLKAPDAETLEDYLAARPGFVTFHVEGRVWIFRAASKDLEDFKKHGPPEKHATLINGLADRVTAKAPDLETIDAYLKARDE